MSGIDITNIEEKPIYQSYINAGVYALSPKSLKYLEKNVFCNMTTLFEKIKNLWSEFLVFLFLSIG